MGEPSSPTAQSPPILPNSLADANQKATPVSAELRKDSSALLRVWLDGGSISEFLRTLPSYKPAATLDNCVAQFRNAVTSLLGDHISSAAAMQTVPMFAETISYPFAVMLHAASTASATPLALLLDTVVGVLHSLVHKDFALQLGRWENKSRYWFIGTADSGDGKRQAMKPVISVAQQILKDLPGLVPGFLLDDFHMQQSCTTASAIDKLRQNDGYLLLHSDEAGQCLDLNFSSSASGATKKGEHVDLTMFLDPAHGDEFHHTTMIDRKKAAKRDPPHRRDPVPEPPAMTMSTNMQVCWLQQEMYFLQYWCLAAFTKPIGLVQRCLFSFGRQMPAPSPRLNAFWKDAFLPFLDAVLRHTVIKYGPKSPRAGERRLHLIAKQEQLVFQLEEVCKVMSSQRDVDLVMKGALPKCLYWLGTCIRSNFFLDDAMRSYMNVGDTGSLSSCERRQFHCSGQLLVSALFVWHVCGCHFCVRTQLVHSHRATAALHRQNHPVRAAGSSCY